MRRLLVWLVCGFCLLCTSAIAATTPLQQFFREQWTTRDGLPHNTINDIAQSDDGYLWLATWDGAARYDGRSFAVFDRSLIPQLPDSGMRVLWRDKERQLFAGGSRGGLSWYQQGKWQVLPPVGYLINGVARDDRGLLWLATEGGGVVRQLQDGTYQRFGAAQGLESTVVNKILADADGILWFATPLGLYSADPQVKQPTFVRVAPEAGLPAETILVLALDPLRQLLIGTERGLYRRQGSRFELLEPRLADLSVSALYVQDNGDIWIGTSNQGLFRLSGYGLEQLTVTDGLPNNRVLAIYQDEEQSIWVGTNGGLFRLREAPFTNLSQANGLADNYVRTVLQHSDGSIWVGSAGGLDRYNQGRWSRVRLSSSDSVLSLAEGKAGSLWVGTYTDGVYQLDSQQQIVAHYHRRNGLHSNEVRAIADTAAGIWFGTTQGLHQLKDGHLTAFGLEDGLSTLFITALRPVQIAGQQPALLVGTADGAAIIEQGLLRPLDLSGLDNAEYVFDFYPERGGEYVWMVTDRGLVRHRLRDGQQAILGKQHGLPVEKFFSILPETEQWFWLSSNRGVLRLSRAEVHQVMDGERPTLKAIEQFGEQDGMASAQANGGSMPAAVKLLDGSIWFATSQGVAMVDPRQLARFSSRTPPVVVQALLGDGQSYPVQSGVNLVAGTRRLAVHYAGLSYIMPSRIQYQTRLEGFDQEWVNRGNLHHVEYTNLPPGQYQLRIRAAYPDNDWSLTETSLAFRIMPFWWQQPLVQLAALTVLLLIVALLLRWRLYRLSQSELKLRQQVGEKTAELLAQAQTLRLAVQEKTDLAEQLKVQAQMFARQAHEDALTGVANRRAFDQQLAQTYQQAQQDGRPLCLALLDLDHFKQINDRWSHQIGDLVLVRVAALLKTLVRDSDWVARWGGEEFAIVFTDTYLEEAVEICQRLRLAIAALDFAPEAEQLKVTASIGLAMQNQSDSYARMLSLADQQLYRAKKQGRDQVCYVGMPRATE